MNPAAAVIFRVYRWLLTLYPVSFRTDFADEMREVFEQTFQDAAQQGAASALAVCLRELADLPVNLILEHAHQKRKPMKPFFGNPIHDIQTARWIARISTLLLTAFFGFVILRTEQPALFTLTALVMTVTLLSAWHWEKTGGLLTLAATLVCALLVGLNATLSVLSLGAMKAVLWGIGCTLVVLTVWFLPYQLIAWLFLSLGRHSERAAQQPVQGSPA